MPKQRTGFVQKRDGKWWARVTYIDMASGRRRDLRRLAKRKRDGKSTKGAASELLRHLLDEAERTDGRSIDHERKTFADLVEFYGTRYVQPAEYDHEHERKVSGLRSCATVKRQLRMIGQYFGQTRLRSITYETLRRFKEDRHRTPTRRGGKRTIATMNRELALLRRMLNVALREGWISRNAFEGGDALISPADERQRERILTPEEEARLIAAASGTRARELLRSIIVLALDTGMRQGEIFKLRWSDVDFVSRRITVRAFNTKTMRERQVSMTSRVYAELDRLRAASSGESVFGISDNVKRSFTAVRRIAGLPDVRFHDLRHTAATRLARGQLSLAEVGRILGHTQPRTTYRYVNADGATADRAAAILDTFGQATPAEIPVN